MASTSGQRSGAPLGKLRSVTGMLDSDNQSLIREIRKTMNLMKEVAVDLEKENMSDKVKELETGLVEMLETSNDCLHFSNAIQSIGSVYEPGPEPTDFKKVFDAEIRKSKAISPSQNHALLRQFREAVWNVHHAGQPMPGEEEDDIVMTSSACNLLNVTCPLSGKPVTELVEPVRSRECKHIFEKAAIMRHIKNARGKCPVAGCPKLVHANKVACDAFLLVEIDELRSMGNEAGGSGMVEDVTDLPGGTVEVDED